MTRDELEIIRRGVVTGVGELVTRLLEAPLGRIKALEMAPPPRDGRDGLPGRDGVPGEAGTPGAAGADGLGFDDLDVTFDGERTLALTFTRGALRKTFPVVLPCPVYQGVFQDAVPYAKGDLVTDGGVWHANEATTARPGSSKAWTLIMKRARDGKDGKDGPRGADGPAGQDWQQVYDAAAARRSR